MKEKEYKYKKLEKIKYWEKNIIPHMKYCRTVKALCDYLDISDETLNTYSKKVFGKTPKKLLDVYRQQELIEMLETIEAKMSTTDENGTPVFVSPVEYKLYYQYTANYNERMVEAEQKREEFLEKHKHEKEKLEFEKEKFEFFKNNNMISKITFDNVEIVEE